MPLLVLALTVRLPYSVHSGEGIAAKGAIRMTTDTERTYAHDYADTIAEEVLSLADGVLEGYEPEDRVDALMTWLNDLTLDVEVTRNLATGDVTAVEFARTLGGPTCYVRFDQYYGVVVRASWGSDRALVTLPYDAGRDLAELMLTLMDEGAA